MMPSSLPRIAAREILRDLERQAASDDGVLSAEAYFALGGCYINGSLTDQDYPTGVDHLWRAAELKHPGAIGSLLGIQAALENIASSQTRDTNSERTAVFDADGREALSAQLGGLLYLNMGGYLKTAMEMSLIPRSHAWKNWGKSAYRAYRSSPHRLARARSGLIFVKRRIDTPAAGDAQEAQRAVDRHRLNIFLHYILQQDTSPLGVMAMSYREIFYGTGGVDINCPVDDGFTVLQHAVLSGKRDAVEAAIKFGVDIDATGRTPGWTPLWLSVVTGQGAVAQLLLENGASTNCRDTRTGATLLHLLHQLTTKGHIETVLQGVLRSDCGVSIDTLANGITPLLACFVGWDYSKGKAARALLRHGANPTSSVTIGLRPEVDASPISLCATTLDYLLLKDMVGCPWAASHGNQPQGQKALTAARCGADISVLAKPEFYYRSILGDRFQHALEEFLKLIITGDMKKQLREMVYGRDGGDTDPWVAGPVAMALWLSRAYVVRSLLRLFSCGDIPPSPSWRPLIQLAIERRMRGTIIDLLQRGADLLALEPTGYTALHSAAHYYPEILLELVDHLQKLPPSARRGKTMKQILQAKDSRELDVRSLLLLEGHRAELDIMTELRDRFDLDMDAYDMPDSMTLTGMCVALIAESGSVLISQLEYLLRMCPKPKFVCDAKGNTLLGFAISGQQGSMFILFFFNVPSLTGCLESRTAPTPSRRLITLILNHYPSMANLLTGEHGPFYRAARFGNIVALELMEERLRRVTPPDLGTHRFIHAMLYGSRGSGKEKEFSALEITRANDGVQETRSFCCHQAKNVL